LTIMSGASELMKVQHRSLLLSLLSSSSSFFFSSSSTFFFFFLDGNSPLQTFTSWKNFSQWALFYDLFVQFLVLCLLTSVSEQFHHLFSGHRLSQLFWGLLLNTWLTFFVLSILLTWPFQFNLF